MTHTKSQVWDFFPQILHNYGNISIIHTIHGLLFPASCGFRDTERLRDFQSKIYALRLPRSALYKVQNTINFVMDTILWNGYMKKLSGIEMKSTSSGHFYYIYHQHLYPQLFLWSIATNSGNVR